MIRMILGHELKALDAHFKAVDEMNDFGLWD